MALGGGTWTVQNKVLPGAYINYVSAQRAGITMSERGTVALPIELDWGADGQVIEVNGAGGSVRIMEGSGQGIGAVRRDEQHDSPH